MNGPSNDEMQRTSHGRDGGSPLISVFYGPDAQTRMTSRKTRRPSYWSQASALRVSETTCKGREEFHNDGRGSIAWMGYARIRECRRTTRCS